MGERKVVNKYVPWDFDPDKASKIKLSNIGQFSVRMMLPFTVRCNSCGEFMYAGKKFNTRKETAQGETYLGIPIQRFYFKCTNCGSEFAIKTDPKNCDYAVESGATRNACLWKNERQLEMEEKKQQEEAEEMDAIKVLENRTEESRREMDIYDALDTLQEQQRKSMNTDPEEALEIIRKKEELRKKMEEKQKHLEEDSEDEREFQDILKKKNELEEEKKDESYKNAFAQVNKNNSQKSSATQKITVLPNGMKLAVKKKKKTNEKHTEPKKMSSLVGY